MATERNINKLEKEIRVKMMQIRSGKLKPKDSFDEPLHSQIISEYKFLINKK